MAVLPTGIGPVTGGYQIERSLRFNSADSAYLNRTLTTPTSRKIMTFSYWVKRTGLAKYSQLWNNFSGATAYGQIAFNASDGIDIYSRINGTTTNCSLITSSVYRDTSAWYHIVVQIDTSQATSSNRVRLYVNGLQVTAFSSATYPAQNDDVDFQIASRSTSIGRRADGGDSTQDLPAYLTEINMIDGQSLTPSSFGETDSNTGVWKPKAYSGTYGTNGFYLKFADNSNTTAGTLGKDSSGNGNNWTPNNFSVTAGAGNDSLVDSPTSYGTDTGIGGEVRGNYCTWNPLKMGNITLTNGALRAKSTAAAYNGALATMQFPSGKIYFEGTIIAVSVGNNLGIGMASPTSTLSGRDGAADNNFLYIDATNSVGALSYAMYGSGNNYTALSLGSSAVNDVMMVAYDYDTGKIWLGANGTWYNSGNPASGTNPTATMTNPSNKFPYMLGYSSSEVEANFGQRAFAYTAPSGFKALCTQNLPTPTIGATSTTQANDYFNAVLYTGNASVKAVTGVGFQPDFTWVKGRSYAGSNNAVTDAVRGLNKVLLTNLTNAEITGTTYFNSIDSDGFTLNTDSNSYNGNNETYVAWNWKANGAGSSNTAGTITSTVSANTTSGFSIVTYTGNATSGATVGHGLGVAPNLIIVRNRTASAQNWQVYSSVLGATKRLFLDLTDTENTFSGAWNNTAPTSTVFSLGNATDVNGNTNNFVAYCFAAVAGYSAFGSYVGNGSADGPFVYTGFRPRWVMVKEATVSARDWIILDSARNTYNVADLQLMPNKSDAEATTVLSSTAYLDFVSNGFKVRNTSVRNNENTATYIYAAFAEHPFKYSLAR